MNVIYRLERPSDYSDTENVTREAFWNHFSPGCDEHYLVHIMRERPAFVPELDVVAVDEGEIVGNIMYARSIIETDDGNEYEVLCLGPISVHPKYQNKGIGSRLIEYTRGLAQDMGFRAILLMGDPDYYSRQGFISAERFGIRTSDNMYAAALQIYELYDNALLNKQGRFIENEVYNVDSIAASEFDKKFPSKKTVQDTPSQKRFREVVAMRKK